MITTTHRCEVCGRHATRQALDRPHPETGYRWTMWLCDDCPSPEDVDSRAAEIRAGWSDAEHYQKAWDCNRHGVAYRLEYQFPQCRPLRLDGMVDRREVLPG